MGRTQISMKTVKGPALFLAQFMDDVAPFNTLDSVCKWASSLGYKGVQIPTWDKRCVDLERLANDLDYVKEIQRTVSKYGLEITELSTHLQGQLVAVHAVYDNGFDVFAPEELRNNPVERQQWAIHQLKLAAKASANLSLKAHATFSGAMLWPYIYPWPQRKKLDVKEGFQALAKLWLSILDECDKYGVDLCYELHPGEDLHDGVSFELFLEACNQHKRANILYDPSHFLLQQMKYLDFIDIYHERIKMFHVKDAEFNPTGKSGVYGGYQDWINRPGRFRSLGDGQIDFKSIFSKLTQYDFEGWAVVEWECCMKHPEVGAKEGAEFVTKHIIPVTEKSFDDFASWEL